MHTLKWEQRSLMELEAEVKYRSTQKENKKFPVRNV